MGRRDFFEEQKLKKMIYIFSITLVVSIIAFLAIFIMYNKALQNASKQSLLELGAVNDIVPNDDITQTSISSDSTVSNSTNTTNTATAQNTQNTQKSTNTTNTVNKTRNVVNTTPISSVVTNNTVHTAANEVETNTTNTAVNASAVENATQENEELSFIAPVSGEIIKDFAMDTLIYSNTLEEWTTHSGIDIKADKTSIVVASEAGTVESIKNDPRYGLTVTIAHKNGFKTVYANLLTAEFVKEGDTVERGQTLGTVGESASFEISDEAHLHFEMSLEGNSVNPTIYLKDM